MSVELRRCSRCTTLQLLNEDNFKKYRNDAFYKTCKRCSNKPFGNIYGSPTTRPNDPIDTYSGNIFRICIKCKNLKAFDEINFSKKKNGGYLKTCKTCCEKSKNNRKINVPEDEKEPEE